jgi:hypothetical protein
LGAAPFTVLFILLTLELGKLGSNPFISFAIPAMANLLDIELLISCTIKLHMYWFSRDREDRVNPL